MANHFELAERLLTVARKDKAKWLVAAKRESKKTDDFAEDREETCLVGANAVDQVIRKMEREIRLARNAAQGIETRSAIDAKRRGPKGESPVRVANAPEHGSEHSSSSPPLRGRKCHD